MRRKNSSVLVSWLIAPVAAVLVQSALSLPVQPYTGLVLRSGWVAEVLPGGPGDLAGLEPNDRLERTSALSGARALSLGPIADAQPGRPLLLRRTRDGVERPVWLVPAALPDHERRVMAGMIAVACGFVLLGGAVWGERRDPLARTFYLLCLAFAWLVAPLRRWTSPMLATGDVAVITAIEVYLPALFIHFFALFPEASGRRRFHWVRAGYAIASLLFTISLVLLIPTVTGGGESARGNALLNQVGSLWFALGFLVAIGLFLLSYARAGSGDARRRLRVTLAGTVLGVAPLAGLIVVRSLSPGTSIPGERWAIALTLLVPASFAWAIVVHRVFDFRVALRGVVIMALLALAASLLFLLGEWAAATWWPDWSAHIAGGTLACVALAASLGGPLAPWLGALAARLVPGDRESPLSDHVPRLLDSRGDRTREEGIERLLAEACDAVAGFLRVDSCIALLAREGAARSIRGSLAGATALPGPSLWGRAFALPAGSVTRVDQSPLEAADRDAFEHAGVSWFLPVGPDPVRAVFLFGHRIAGTWLSRREVVELERFAGHLGISLENAALRLEARSRGRLDRDLREAGAIQAHLLPRHAPVYPTLDCAAASLSSEPVGGDYYDFVEGPDRGFTLAVGDAAGKGIPAALLLAQAQARFRSQARRGLSPSQLLTVLNQELVGFDQPEKFVGLLCAQVDVRLARVSFANAGLTPPLVFRADGSVEEIEPGGVLLGVSADATYPEVEVRLGAGDVVVVYTDGLTEARRGEELFGTDRVRETVTRCQKRRAVDILEALIDAVREFATSPLDDLTVMVLRQLTSVTEEAGPTSGLKPATPPDDARKRGDTRPPSPVRAANPRTSER